MKKIIKYLLLTSFIIFCFSCQNEPELIKLSGPVFGTGYNIQYFSMDGENYQNNINQLFDEVNQSLSTYHKDSDISKVNRNEKDEVDEHFKTVFEASKKIYRETEGAFDPTIGNVVNAWNFGAENNKFETDSTTIDSLMRYVGFNRIGFSDGKIKKQNTSIYLEFNAIAKGYGIDVIANFLETKGIKHYLVEIGGEIRAKGMNLKKEANWRVGVQRPRFDGVQDPNDYSIAISLENESMATSGSYRKFKTDENGNRYTHIINTKTGYPTKTKILSVSVIAPNTMLADGYATAFKVMGVEKVKVFLEQHPELKVYFIYEKEDQTMETLGLNGFPID
jgi:thiamine biosynthesis lipoprotein